MNLVLANIDYEPGPGRGHLTDEGHQLQAGLADQGWMLCGTGYRDGCKDVRILLDRYKPRAVFVSQKSDWDPKSAGSFRKDLGFLNLGELKSRKDIFKICPVKDASQPEYQRQFCEEIGADLVVHYYHLNSIGALCPWLKDYRTLRIYHSIDAQHAQLCFAGVWLEKHGSSGEPRRRAIVSGAVSGVYPFRDFVMRVASGARIDVLRHPGYSNLGSESKNYLRTLASYKVHIATCSKFGFALRKIIESVAVGTIPLTNLPDYDVLPEIDGALVRIMPHKDPDLLNYQVTVTAASWNVEERLRWAEACWQFYDWRLAGERLNAEIEKAMADGITV